MVKLLRKYNKWLIAVFGSFLMVTFLFTGPGNFLTPDPLRTVEGRIGETKVRLGEVQVYSQQYEALRELAPGLIQSQLQVKDAIHWMLLAKEADQLGLIGNAADGAAYISELAQMQLPMVVARQIIAEEDARNPQIGNLLRQNPQILNFMVMQRLRESAGQLDALTVQAQAELEQAKGMVAGQYRMRPDEMDMALANLRGVMRLAELYGSAPRLSDRRLTMAARSAEQLTLADVLVLRAADFVDPSFQPTPEALQAQFERFKATQPGEGEFGAGYAQPARIRVEWFTLTRDAVDQAITLDAVEVNKHYLQHRDRFPGEFATERTNVERELRERRIADVFAEADRAFKARLRSDTRKLETRGGLKRLPPDWATQRPSMASLAEAMVAGVRQGARIELAAPRVEARTDAWVRLPEVAQLPGIGQGVYATGTRSIPFADLAAGVAELDPLSGLGLQAMVPFESALRTGRDDRTYFVITAVRGPSAADTLDEVREQVVRDVRERAAYDKLAAEVEELRLRAAGEGLDALASLMAQRAASLQPGATPPSVKRSARFNDQFIDPALRLSSAEPLRDAVLAAGAALGVLTAADQTNRPLRTTGAALPGDRAVAIAQLTGFEALTQERMRLLNQRVAQRFASRELESSQTDATSLPLAFEAVKQRLRWQPVGETKPAAPSAPATPAPAPTPTQG